MKIAVIGAGVYGCTIALKLAESGFDVDLIEKEHDIMQVTSFISRRSHMGYFYPRSIEMIKSCREHAPLFETYYPEAIVRGNTTYYAIAKNDSKITGKEFLEALDSHGLPYTQSSHSLLDSSSIELCLEVPENYYDPLILRNVIKDRLQKSTVKLFLNTDARNHAMDEYDLKIIAAYAHNNTVVGAFDENFKEDREYRLCEKIVVELPEEFNDRSFVIMDGPFFQVEPYGTEKGKFVISHFIHSIHDKHDGDSFATDEELQRLLRPDSVVDEGRTRFKDIIQAVSFFLPETKKARYISSIYAIKPVNINEAGDAKPVVVKPVREDILTVFSGKVSGSMKAAEACIKYAKDLERNYLARASKSRTASTAI